ncbi:O-antigen ligase family protein [Acidicapsa dinghuensis]|uniref:O-antigen ligase family protein n=1 Tax=Acidicapsa dinghuensis TaxID=2218256 RepID=A0ABW1EC92_9BACT|nr:hypothetical protein [Acidicapsa dinghuensis]
MHLPPFAALIAWIPLAALLFGRFPVRIAILANFFLGWAILPGAPYVPTTADFPYWILGICLPSTYFLTKATAVGLSALAGMLLFHRRDWRRWLPARTDLPVLLWSSAPLLATHAHWSLLARGSSSAVYQLLAWAVPWILGRIYFSDRASLILFAKSCVFAGLCYVPVCLFEWISGPQIYHFLYGYQPYRLVGADRYFGYRPVGLLEDGNQLGIWMATASLLAISLAFYLLALKVWRIPMTWAAIVLTISTLLCQSVGSIVLLICLFPLVLLRQRLFMRVVLGAAVVGIAAFVVFLVVPHPSLRAIAASSTFVRHIAGIFQEIGRHSFVWRLARDESHLAIAMQHPWLGSGEWNWWRTGDARPWSLWLLVFGMYGLFGVMALGSMFLLPLTRFARSPKLKGEAISRYLFRALAAAILMSAFDALLNGDFILVYLIAMGGMAAWRHSPQSSTVPLTPESVPDPHRRQEPSSPHGAVKSSPARLPQLNSTVHQ